MECGQGRPTQPGTASQSKANARITRPPFPEYHSAQSNVEGEVELPHSLCLQAADKPAVQSDSITQSPAGLEPAIEFLSKSMPRLVVRSPTNLGGETSDIEDLSADEFSSSSRSPSVGSSPGQSTLDSTTQTTPAELGLGLHYEEDIVRAKELGEPDGTLIDETHRALNEAVVGDISSLVDRASRTGHGLPTKLKRNHNVRYEPSERSVITDLGAKERDRITSKTGQIKQAQPLVLSEEELKRPLQERLLDIINDIPGHEEKKGFFPEATLAALVDQQCVEDELRACLRGSLDSGSIRRTAQIICGTGPGFHGKPPLLYKKIFVTLVLSEKISSILLFTAAEVSDVDLPLSKVRRNGKSRLFGLARKRNPGVPLSCFEEWSNLAIMRFEEWQWTTLAPFFNRSERKNVAHWVLQDQIPLPFTADSRYDDDAFDRLEFEGGNSTVFRVDIHPEHHSFIGPDDPNRSFAIKCLLSRNRDEFKQEADTLRKFSGDAHKHLISVLATFEQYKKFYLIFPWAEAHLKDFWEEKNPNPTMDYDTVLWVAEQCRGIADGLLKIHHYESSHSKYNNSHHHLKPNRLRHSQNRKPRGAAEKLFGRHGDIKPENILWFRDPNDENDKGILKITDFGLTEFSTNHSRFYKPKSKVAMTPSYRAPECDLHDGGAGPSSDIWSLGCIYLELIAWLLGGEKLVQEFHSKRMAFDPMFFDFHTDTFFEIVNCKIPNGTTTGAMVKPAVSKFIIELHAHANVTEFIHEFLDLIKQDMLVIKSPDHQDRSRITCQEVDARLYSLLTRCLNDSEYAVRPCPWDKAVKEPGNVEKAVETDVAIPAAEILQWKQLRIHEGPTQRRPVPDSAAVALYRQITEGLTENDVIGPPVTKSQSV